MRTGLFQDFVSKNSDWSRLVEAELKKPGAAESLKWQVDEGFTIDPYQESYINGDAEKLANAVAAFVLKPADVEFYNCQSFNAGSPNLNQELLKALNGGINGLQINGDLNANTLGAALKGIYHEVLWLDLYSKENPTSILLGLDSVFFGSPEKDASKQMGSICMAPLQKLATDGSFDIDSLAVYLKELKRLPLVKGISIDAGLVANAGGTITQQIAFALCQGNEYLNWAQENNQDLNDVSERMHFRFAIGPNFLVESVKVRAFKWLWNRVLAQYNISQGPCFVSTTTSEFASSIYDSHNNLLRYTTATLAAIVGGSDAHSVFNFDNQYKESSEFSERISRNITNLLLEESFVGKVQNVTHGSFAFDNIQYQLCEKSWELFKEWEKAGGYINAMESGVIQSAIRHSAAVLVQKFEENKLVVLGVNKYPNKNESKGKDWNGSVSANANDKIIRPFRVAEKMELERLNQEVAVS